MPEPDDRWVTLVTDLEDLLGLLRRLDEPPRITPTSVATLRTLALGQRRLSELARAEGVTQPGMTQLVTRLEQAGWATRSADPADGRAVLVGITPAGGELLAHRRRARAGRLAGPLGQLTPAEQQTLLAALPLISRLASLAAEQLSGIDTPHPQKEPV